MKARPVRRPLKWTPDLRQPLKAEGVLRRVIIDGQGAVGEVALQAGQRLTAVRSAGPTPPSPAPAPTPDERTPSRCSFTHRHTKLALRPLAKATAAIDTPGCRQAATTRALKCGECLRRVRGAGSEITPVAIVSTSFRVGTILANDRGVSGRWDGGTLTAVYISRIMCAAIPSLLGRRAVPWGSGRSPLASSPWSRASWNTATGSLTRARQGHDTACANSQGRATLRADFP
jgi:hypothetical protein